VRESDNIHVRKSEFIISPTNRITYVFKETDDKKVAEVTCVSLEILVSKNWETIIYFDSSHAGRLHRHTRISLADQADVVDETSVKKKGSQKELLTWAINNIKGNFMSYKRRS